MDRLTKRDRHGNPMPKELRGMGYGQWHEMVDFFERLAEYEDEEEQGRLIKFPVAIGDHLWTVDDYGTVKELVVHELIQSVDGQLMLADSSGLRSYYSLNNIGESLFLTRKQAEARLVEMGK